MSNSPKTFPIFIPKNNSSCQLFNLNNNNSSRTNFERMNKNIRKETSYNKNNRNIINNNEVPINNDLLQRSIFNIEGNDMNLKKNFVRNKTQQNLKRNNIRSKSSKIKIANNNYFQHTNNFRMEKNIPKTKNLENNSKRNKENGQINQLIVSDNLKSNRNIKKIENNFSKNKNHFGQWNKKMLNNKNRQSMDINKYAQDNIKTQTPVKININTTFINIIYLLDTTYSMEKNKDIIYSLKNINDRLKSQFKNIQYGFVLYKDFYIEPFSLELNQSHIKVYPPSKESFINDEINFIGGYDYAEDWANAYYEISKLDLSYNYQNIIIHFCDSGAHGKKFSDYDYKNKQEALLFQALDLCAKKKFKIIGLLYNEFARKSFLACAKIYKGYYNLVDLTLDDMTEENRFYEKIFENIKDALENKKNMTFLDDYSQIKDFENDFDWGKKKVNMTILKKIKNKYYNNLKYVFLPILNGTNIKEINKFVKSSPTPYLDPKTGNYDNSNCLIKTGLKQGYIGDCYLISPIISLIYNKIPLTEYIFPKTDYDQNTERIEMYIYENGVRKLITFKNTYATNNNYFIFSSPLNNAFFGMSIEKGYAVNNSDGKTIKSGFGKIGKGGFSFNVFNSLFGAESEIFTRENAIQKEELKNKIKKYLDFNGLISFGVYFNISEQGHAFSLIGYKEYQNDEFYIEILNPHHQGKYLENNIKKNDIYNYSSEEIKKKFNSESKGKNIYEEEFKNNQEIYKIFNNYEKTGFLTMKLDTFFNWFRIICFCDPMLGYLESIVEINKEENNNNKIYFTITKETKFRAFLLVSEKEISDLNEQMEFFQNQKKVNPIKYCIYLEKDNNSKKNINKGIKNSKNLIYEKLMPGNYMIQIYPAKIEKNLYLKIQADNIFIYDKKRKDDLSNSIMSRYNCNCLDKYIRSKECYFCQIYSAYQLIDIIVKSLIELINYYHNYIYNNNNNFYNIEIYNELLLVNSEYNIPCKSNSHLYYHYMSTEGGFIVLIINKFNFNWEYKQRIEYNKNNQQFIAFFEFGTFTITKNLIAFNYDNTNFKNILTSLGYYEKSFNLLNIDNSIKIREEKIKYESNKYIEGQNLEKIKNQQTTEQQKLEQIKSQYILEVKNLELIKNQLATEQQKLEQLRNTLRSEQKDLDRIKSLKISEQLILDKIKIEQENYKKFNCLENALINLEESKINFNNIDYSSCYQSSTLQGFIHLIYPKAIRKLNEEKIKKGESIIQCLGELKNYIKFNDMVIDILKDIINKENERKNNSSNNNNNNKNYRAGKIFKEFPPENGSSQGLLNEYDCNKLHERLIYGGKIIDFCSSDNESVSDLKALLLKLSKSKKELLFLIF